MLVGAFFAIFFPLREIHIAAFSTRSISRDYSQVEHIFKCIKNLSFQRKCELCP